MECRRKEIATVGRFDADPGAGELHVAVTWTCQRVVTLSPAAAKPLPDLTRVPGTWERASDPSAGIPVVRREAVLECCGHVAEQRELEVGPVLDRRPQRVHGAGADVAAFDDGPHQTLVKLRLVEDADYAELFHFLA